MHSSEVVFLLVLFLFDFALATRYLGFELKGKDTAISGRQPFQQEHVHAPQECLRRCIRQVSQCALAQHEPLTGDSGWICRLFRFISDLPSYLITKTGAELYSLAVQEDCLAWRDAGYPHNAIYRLANGRAVFCDMTTNGGGWTVIQRRIDGSVDFYRGWDEYKNGFGDSNGEYWIGNDVIHTLTKDQTQNMMIRVEATAFDGSTNYVIVDGFWIEDELNDYRIHLGQLLEGEQPHYEDFSTMDGKKFSTHDRDNDENVNSNCATINKGGYWYKACRRVSPNGLYSHTPQCNFPQGIIWITWKPDICLKAISLAIKRKI